MPELPDVLVYREALERFVVGRTVSGVRLTDPFVLRTAEPPLARLVGGTWDQAHRLGKQLILSQGALHLVIHPMIAGRLRWRPPGQAPAGKIGRLAIDMPHGTLWLTEAGTRRRAAVHLVEGDDALRAFDRGALNVMTADLPAFVAVLRAENHTLKRSLTDPRLFDGIGNAYSDEILHAARLSPMRLTSRLTDAEIARLHDATRTTLAAWTDRLRRQVGDGFPEEVTAFRPEMAVHGRYNQPCPVCGQPVQRIRYADNECNYCAQCQNQGSLLADRSLSRLLKSDWPRTLEELEARRGR